MKQHVFRQDIRMRFQYQVVFTRNLFVPTNTALRGALNTDVPPAKVLVFIDRGVRQAWPKLDNWIQSWAAAHADCCNLLGIHEVPGGEAAKNQPELIDWVGELVHRHKLCRHSFIMVIGGGAVLDAVGFGAAIVHRGIRLLRVPTTVLSQNDSGMGVKNGVNRFGVKNYLGAFAPPSAVFCDLEFLHTLSDRVWISGVAEAFKVACIKDRAFLAELVAGAAALRHREENIGQRMITRTAELHLNHIASAGDPFEFGSSRPLDFGHWAAHRLESMSRFQLLHGEAVAIGMAIDLLCASQLGFISRAEAKSIIQAMSQCGLPVYHPLLKEDLNGVLLGLEEFREHLGGRLTLAMPCPLGEKTDISQLDRTLVEKAVFLLKPKKSTLASVTK